MREQFNNVCVTLLLVAEILLALLIGYRMVNSIGWDGHNYTYQTSDSDYLLTTEYDVHWQKGNVTYKGTKRDRIR